MEEEKNVLKNKGRFIDNINDNISPQFSGKKFPFNTNFRRKNNKINKNELLNFNGKNIFNIGRDNSNKKILIRNKSDNVLTTKDKNIYQDNNRYIDHNFNPKILDNIYKNNYSTNNLKKQEYGFNIKNNCKNKNSKDSNSSINPLNENTGYLFPNNRSNNELTYNKIFGKNKIISTSYSIFTPHEKSISNREGPIKGRTSSLNNNSKNHFVKCRGN